MNGIPAAPPSQRSAHIVSPVIGKGKNMEKEYRFEDKIGRHVNWNKLIPEMVDVWFNVMVTKDIETGEIVVRVVEEKEKQ